MSDTTRMQCKCLDSECVSDAFHETDIGVDQTPRGLANVSLFDCRFCGHRWLHFALGHEAWEQSNRWYRGPLSVHHSRLVTSENALALLASLPWYFYGGTDFDTNGQQGCGPILFELEDLLSK
jgi:hypothetical protein